ncbi:hypothetical protein ONE63_001818 [Megalurothrips usitatus]|uniref:Nucleolar protein of 40 kDa-like n=1 Tax=Megalurothrips usitatus TaxID=439358 RepID=A0AAV7XDX4_9NEOP|nr:hypothetical protein ONE63_001818 [Megalurothrips usitatus]
MAASKDTIFLGEVSSVQPYGAFVKIPGCANQGLVHRSQISKVNVPEVSEVLSKGDRVWCKVISTEDNKIGLSMKVVDQGSGRDLDPNGVQMQLDEQRRKEWVPGGKQKTISLEAVYNTTCSKCGTRGHLGKDCFQSAGGKTYELIPEEDPEKPRLLRPPPTDNSGVQDPLNDKAEEKRRRKEAKKERKEAKRVKKEAKKKKKAAKKLKKKLKKEAKKARKQKKKKQQSSSDSNDSEDSSSSSSSSGSGSESEDESHLKEKTQRKGLAPNSYKSQKRRSRSRSPVRESKKHRNDMSSSRDRETRETSLDGRSRTRR